MSLPEETGSPYPQSLQSSPLGRTVLFGPSIFLGAFLLFAVEPLIAKRILPWFGGSAAVWSTCLVFYQVALLAGYLYAQVLTRYLNISRQATTHVVVLLLSLCLLPIGPGSAWKQASVGHPSLHIFEMLILTVALPFSVLSATGPLLQSWLARSGTAFPYRMFAVSNFASFAALFAYPLLIEPFFGIESQRRGWSFCYSVFVVLCGIAAYANRHTESKEAVLVPLAHCSTPLFTRLKWLLLSACGSMLLLSLTNHINENVAAVPMLWVLPLGVYLLSFVLTFSDLGIYRLAIWLRLLAFALGVLGYSLYNIDAVEAIQVSLPIFLAGLFICCVFCHGELNRLRPQAGELTLFYLLIAAGGAGGAIFIGLIAPMMFGGIYELPITLVFTALLGLAAIWSSHAWSPRLLWVAITGCMVLVTVLDVDGYQAHTIALRRSFYGSLRVTQSAHAGPEEQRILFHGTIEHGAQYMVPPLRSRPTTYYGPDSGVGILLRECYSGPKSVGVVGLGIGTIAAYGHPGDDYIFYEINTQIVDIAQSLFFYTRESPAHIHIRVGDGRLSLEREKFPPFNVLVLDAFSGDAIPVHLLTREAFRLYLQHLAAGGTLAFHVSNDFLDLAPVVQQLASSVGYRAVLVHNHASPEDSTLPADWVLVTKNAAVLDNPSVRVHSQPIATRAGLRLWTDDYNDLLQIFKTPELKQR